MFKIKIYVLPLLVYIIYIINKTCEFNREILLNFAYLTQIVTRPIFYYVFHFNLKAYKNKYAADVAGIIVREK